MGFISNVMSNTQVVIANGEQNDNVDSCDIMVEK